MGDTNTPKPKNVAIDATAHAAFRRTCKNRAVGREMTDALSRLIEWFVRQPPPVQTAVTSDVDSGMQGHYAAALELLAAELRGAPSDRTGSGYDASETVDAIAKLRAPRKQSHGERVSGRAVHKP